MKLLRDHTENRIYQADAETLKSYIRHFGRNALSGWNVFHDTDFPNGAFSILFSTDRRLPVQLTPKSTLAKMGDGLMTYQGAGPFERSLIYRFQLQAGGYPPNNGTNLAVQLVEDIDPGNEYPPIHDGAWSAPTQLEQLVDLVRQLHDYLSSNLA